MRHACECIRNGLLESPIMPLSESVAIMEMADKLIEMCGISVMAEK